MTRFFLVIDEGTTSTRAMLFRPEVASAPPVLVADGNPGFADWLKDLCTRIAGRGYAVLYVDWMTPRFPPYPVVEAEREAWKRVRNPVIRTRAERPEHRPMWPVWERQTALPVLEGS